MPDDELELLELEDDDDELLELDELEELELEELELEVDEELLDEELPVEPVPPPQAVIVKRMAKVVNRCAALFFIVVFRPCLVSRVVIVKVAVAILEKRLFKG